MIILVPINRVSFNIKILLNYCINIQTNWMKILELILKMKYIIMVMSF